MFQQIFKNIDDVLWKEAGCTTELDYTEQTSWILFLKYLDDLEHDKAVAAELAGKPYAFEPHRWSSWAAPKKADGSFDHDTALTGDDLVAYVNDELFPYLKGFKQRATGPDTIEYKIGEIFGEIKNKFQSGYSLRDALELMDGLRFRSQKEKHELSHLYEAKIKNMGNAGRNGGEYYTPRPLIRAMIHVVKPKIGERIYDGALGSAGFLCEAYDYLRHSDLTTSQLQTLQTKTFYGKEKKSLAYVIAIMNMILHGIEAPNIIHTNTLAENISDIQDKDRFDVILANPPFGGKERPEVQQNFPIKTGETAFLFLQHFIKHLKAGGRAAVVIKNTFLSNSDGAARSLRKELLENCNLHTVLDPHAFGVRQVPPLGLDHGQLVVYHASELADAAHAAPIDLLALRLAGGERRAFRQQRLGQFEPALQTLEKLIDDKELASDAQRRAWLSALAARIAYQLDDEPRGQKLQTSAFAVNNNHTPPKVRPTYVARPLPGIQSAIVNRLLEYERRGALLADFDEAVAELVPEASAARYEEALANLGAYLGFDAERPEKVHGIGPDVLWRTDASFDFVIEAKSDKEEDNPLYKKEHAQLLEAEHWFKVAYPGRNSIRVSALPQALADDKATADGTFALRLAEITKLVGALRGVLAELVATPGTSDVLRERCEVTLQKSKLKPDDIISNFLMPFGAIAAKKPRASSARS